MKTFSGSGFNAVLLALTVIFVSGPLYTANAIAQERETIVDFCRRAGMQSSENPVGAFVNCAIGQFEIKRARVSYDLDRYQERLPKTGCPNPSQGAGLEVDLATLVADVEAYGNELLPFLLVATPVMMSLDKFALVAFKIHFPLLNEGLRKHRRQYLPVATQRVAGLEERMKACGTETPSSCAAPLNEVQAILKAYEGSIGDDLVGRFKAPQAEQKLKTLGAELQRLQTDIAAALKTQERTYRSFCQAGPLVFYADETPQSFDAKLDDARQELTNLRYWAGQTCKAATEQEGRQPAQEMGRREVNLKPTIDRLRAKSSALSAYFSAQKRARTTDVDIDALRRQLAAIDGRTGAIRGEYQAAAEKHFKSYVDRVGSAKKALEASCSANTAKAFGGRLDALSNKFRRAGSIENTVFMDVRNAAERAIDRYDKAERDLGELAAGRLSDQALFLLCKPYLGAYRSALEGGSKEDLATLERLIREFESTNAEINNEKERARQCYADLKDRAPPPVDGPEAERQREEARRLSDAEGMLAACRLDAVATILRTASGSAQWQSLRARYLARRAAEDGARQALDEARALLQSGAWDAAKRRLEGIDPDSICPHTKAEIAAELQSVNARIQEDAEDEQETAKKAESLLQACRFNDSAAAIKLLLPGAPRSALEARWIEAYEREKQAYKLIEEARAIARAGGEQSVIDGRLQAARRLTACATTEAMIASALARIRQRLAEADDADELDEEEKDKDEFEQDQPPQRPEIEKTVDQPEDGDSGKKRVTTAPGSRPRLTMPPDLKGTRWQCYVWYLDKVFFDVDPAAPGVAGGKPVFTTIHPIQQIILQSDHFFALGEDVEGKAAQTRYADGLLKDWEAYFDNQLWPQWPWPALPGMSMPEPDREKSNAEMKKEVNFGRAMILMIFGMARTQPDEDTPKMFAEMRAGFAGLPLVHDLEGPFPSYFDDWRCDPAMPQ